MVAIFEGNAQLLFSGEVLDLNASKRKRFVQLAAWQRLAKIIREFNPDIVQANAADTLKFSVFSKIIYGWRTPIVYRNANKMGDFIDSKVKRIFNQFLLNKCLGIASVSELCRVDFLETFNFKCERTRTLSIGVNSDLNQYDFPEDLKALKGEGPLLINVASLVPEKNHNALLEIFTDIKKQSPNAKLLVLGDGHLKEELKGQIKSMGLGGSVHLLGYRKDVLPIVQHADLFLLPSLIEGLPGVILESFMMKTPVVANNVGGISEVVRDEQTGRLIEPGDTKGFAAACKVLMADAAYAEKLANQAHDLVNTEYLNSIIAKKFESFYEELITS